GAPAPAAGPPPSTRSNSPMPVDTRTSAPCSTSLIAVTFGGSTLPAQPARRAAGDLAEAAGSRRIAESVSQAPHAPHCPCHLLKSAPHSPHTKAVRALAISAF